jgi:hypothetical protein
MINQKLMFVVMAMKFLKTLTLLWAKNGREKNKNKKKRKAPKSPELHRKYCKLCKRKDRMHPYGPAEQS